MHDVEIIKQKLNGQIDIPTLLYDTFIFFCFFFQERSSSMDMESCVPPGFRFHPTEEELVGYYLKRKINSLKIDLDVIVEIDLYKIEPWDIQGI